MASVVGVVKYECDYTFTSECTDGFWWIIVTDPTTKKPVQKVKTDAKCEEKKDK